MSDRNICRYARLDDERKPDQVSRDVVKAVGFGIKYKYRRFFQLRNSRFQYFLTKDGDVVIVRNYRYRRFWRLACNTGSLRLRGWFHPFDL